MLHVGTPPSGVSSLGLVLEFVGSPAAKEYDFPADPPNGEFLPTSYVTLNVPGGSLLGTTYKAGPGGILGGEGPMKMTLSSADPRTPPQTPGDWCLHGTVDATMTVGAAGGSVTLHADF
jgi:hypothetical protein